MRNKRRPVIGALSLLLAGGLVFGGVALAAGGLTGTNNQAPAPPAPPAPTPITYSASLGWTPSVTPGATPDGIVSSVIARAGLATSMVGSLSATPASPGRGLGTSVALQVPTGGTIAENIRAAWQADLVEGVIAEAFAASGMPQVTGSAITGELPNGKAIDLGGGMGDILPGQSYSSDDDGTIGQRLTSLLPQWNLNLVSVDVLHVGQPAPAITVSTSSPNATAAAAAAIINKLFWAQGNAIYEGYFFQVNNMNGDPLLVQSAAFRTGAGDEWVDPSLGDSSSLAHG